MIKNVAHPFYQTGRFREKKNLTSNNWWHLYL